MGAIDRSVNVILDSLSASNIDKNWISSIHLTMNDLAEKQYANIGQNRVIIIHLFPDYVDVFFEGKKATDPIRIMQQ